VTVSPDWEHMVAARGGTDVVAEVRPDGANRGAPISSRGGDPQERREGISRRPSTAPRTSLPATDVRKVRGSIDARPPIPVGCSPETRALSAQQRSSKTGRPAAAVDADLAGGEGADVESGPAQAGIGFAIFFDGEQALVAKR
jgi:hypothetical protein